jgi:molybdate transport system substrate-binding protein
MAVFVRAGASKPEVSTVEAFKRALIDAKSIAYIDSASGAPGGIYLAKLFKHLGIAAVLAPKTKLLGPSGAEKAVAAGDIELGVSQKTVILASPGVELVAPYQRRFRTI